MKTHLRCHSGDKPYKCTLCERSFPHHNTLKLHLKRHFNDRQFVCEYCPKSFIDRTALVRHSQTHTGISFHNNTLNININVKTCLTFKIKSCIINYS